MYETKYVDGSVFPVHFVFPALIQGFCIYQVLDELVKGTGVLMLSVTDSGLGTSPWLNEELGAAFAVLHGWTSKRFQLMLQDEKSVTATK